MSSLIISLKDKRYDLENYDLSQLDSTEAYLYVLGEIDRKSIRTLRELYLKINVEENTQRIYDYNVVAEKLRKLYNKKLIEEQNEGKSEEIITAEKAAADFKRYIELKMIEPETLSVNEANIIEKFEKARLENSQASSSADK